MYLKTVLILLGVFFTLAFASIKYEPIEPKKLYKKKCGICHGSKGRLGIGGASDLSKSTLTMNEAITIITEGKGAMTPFGDILSKKEIKTVAKYIQTLKK